MKRSARAGLISEQSIKDALTSGKGDIFLAACALDCTAQELDRYIRASAELQQFAAAIEKVKIDPAYSRMSVEQFETQLADMTRAYRVTGLQTIHELATMAYGDSAAMAKVKLQAAVSLRGGDNSAGGDRETEQALAELNVLYHQNAPRIREIRQTIIRLEDGPAVIPQISEPGLDLL